MFLYRDMFGYICAREKMGKLGNTACSVLYGDCPERIDTQTGVAHIYIIYLQTYILYGSYNMLFVSSLCAMQVFLFKNRLWLWFMCPKSTTIIWKHFLSFYTTKTLGVRLYIWFYHLIMSNVYWTIQYICKWNKYIISFHLILGNGKNIILRPVLIPVLAYLQIPYV